MTKCICGHPRAVHAIFLPAGCKWQEQTEGWSFFCDCSEFHASTKPTLTTHSPAPEPADSRFERQLAHSQSLESALRERKARIIELEKRVEQANGELATQHGLLLENASTDDLLAELRRRINKGD